MKLEAASGILLLLATAAALFLANSSWSHDFEAIWETPVGFKLGDFLLTGTLGHLVINDGLMALFFFVVGLEIKREMVTGELRQPKKALLPVLAAIGGMVVPAGVYLALQWNRVGHDGWAIPMATDIAFVVGFLAILGSKIPHGFKILMLTLAIVDDIGAVLVIAFAFTEQIAWNWVGVAGAGFALVALFNIIGVRPVGIYLLIGALIWASFLKAGIHPTIAGVLLGLMTPTKSWMPGESIPDILAKTGKALDIEDLEERERRSDLRKIEFAMRESISPLHRLEDAFHPWVAFLIMPLFALANAGVRIDASALSHPIAVAITCGLVIGKPLGILLFAFLGVKLKLTQLPSGVSWRVMIAGSFLGGIGFTMSLFINGLSFPGPAFAGTATAGKIGVLVGSAISALLGAFLLFLVTGPGAEPERK
jgi:NhaA family Na+:H+ antiporter